MACTKRFDMIDSQFVAGTLTEDFAYIPSVCQIRLQVVQVRYDGIFESRRGIWGTFG